MSILFTFPGQGAQRAGMLHTLPDDPLVARTLEEADEALGLDARSLDGAAALESTGAVPLALLIAGVAAARCRQDGRSGPPRRPRKQSFERIAGRSALRAGRPGHPATVSGASGSAVATWTGKHVHP